ncbi:tetratricopeptide repeat protein [Pedobacter psychroterrae]|uniref:Tetratricopeptide repeat protein n=1 Tax=Pedobacter psychroterrae TaxID=2530453 RepID=A0A4R0NJX1_9SPHI|nr:tetratricopeptide repeat protein [Pedobacter psychroterrae]TCD00836.1 tetratricopeptide repeat protein [Pedobacter psychroterrae]
MLNEDRLLAVARYLEGDMEPQERQDFETLLQEDAELREMQASYKDIHQTLKMKIAPTVEDLQLQSTLSALNEQYFKASSAEGEDHPLPKPADEVKVAKVVSMKPYLKWATIAAVLIIGLFVWAPWSSGLYNQYSFSKQMSVAERGADQQNPMAKAAALYNKGDYAEARKILQQEYMMSPQNPLLAYYFAITLIETGQEYEARTVLINLHNGESVFKYDAAFYVALSFVKQDDKEQAVAWLLKIPTENVNYEKAQSLIQKLK